MKVPLRPLSCKSPLVFGTPGCACLCFGNPTPPILNHKSGWMVRELFDVTIAAFVAQVQHALTSYSWREFIPWQLLEPTP